MPPPQPQRCNSVMCPRLALDPVDELQCSQTVAQYGCVGASSPATALFAKLALTQA